MGIQHPSHAAPPARKKSHPCAGASTPVETFFAPACGSSTPVEIFFAPACGSSTTNETLFAHAHPKWLIFDHFHRAGAIFLSQRHPERAPGDTQGRSFFHAAPRDDTESPPVWRAPRGVGPGHGAGGRQGQIGPLTGTSLARLEAAARHGAWPRCRWAAAGPGRATHRHPDRLEAAAGPAGPGRASSRRAERSSRRGRRAGG